jgi:hypothetical protein
MILLTAKHAEKPQSMQRKTICKLNWHTASIPITIREALWHIVFATDSQIKIYLKNVELSEVCKPTFSNFQIKPTANYTHQYYFKTNFLEIIKSFTDNCTK